MIDKLQKHKLGYYEIKKKPTPAELQDYYAKKYYQDSSSKSYKLNYTQDEIEYFRIRNERYYLVVKNIRKIDKGNYLDVGCGEGFGLKFFKERGYKVKGFDFSSRGVSKQNPDCLDDLVTGDIFDLLKVEIESKNTFDIICLNNVLEHVINPLDLLNALHKIIALNGVIVITVPNDFSIIQKEALRRGHIHKNFWVTLPDHLSYFDKNSLTKLCKEADFNVRDLLGDFPIDWYLYHQGSNFIKDRSLGKDAHKARIELECLISRQKHLGMLNFWRSMAAIGSGRNLTIFLTK